MVGLDEAGRGPLAGPVVAAAVMVKKPKTQFFKIKDSKKLSEKKRKYFYKILIRHPAIKWGVGIVSEKVIDKINIKNATEVAMKKAIDNLWMRSRNKKLKIDFLIIDGSTLGYKKLKTKNHKFIVKADEKVFSCAAASIIAKVVRDRMMLKYHQKYPKYHFNFHKGYGTKIHFKLIKKHGPSKIHRRSFRPIINIKNI